MLLLTITHTGVNAHNRNAHNAEEVQRARPVCRVGDHLRYVDNTAKPKVDVSLKHAYMLALNLGNNDKAKKKK